MLAVSLASDSVELIDLPRPQIEDPGDAILLVTTAAIGPWEIEALRRGKNDGVTPGVQFCGTVVEAGDQVDSLDIDDLVVARCVASASGAQQVFGRDGLHGGHAEYVRVPNADETLVKTTPAAEERTVFAGGAAAIGIYLVSDLFENDEQGMLVFAGCDATALCTMALLNQKLGRKGMSRVMAFDSHPARLSVAKSYGAKELDLSEIEPGTVDRLVVGTGVTRSDLGPIISAVQENTEIVFSDPLADVSTDFSLRKVRIIDWPTRDQVKRAEMAIRLRQVDLTPLVSTVLPLDEAAEAYRVAVEAPAGTRSVLLKP